MDGISRETFEQMDTDSKLNVLFDYLVPLNEKVENLNQKAVRWGAIGGIFATLGAYLSSLLIGHISK